ncbi:MAG: tetratricopeptide repeat protein [Xanthomonadales bacterium]|nr:tetratricopeptide repeat protein [Xanthomonadales bacterium]
MKVKKVMHKTISSLTIFILVVMLASCKTTTKSDMKEIAEVNALLRNITVEAIKEKDYHQAQRSINALILNDKFSANDNQENWKFIHPALVSLPKDLAYEVIENALKSNSVNTSSDKLFGLAKVYTSFKDTEAASEIVDRSIALDKNNLDAIFWRARLSAIKGDNKNAEKDFEYVIKKSPKNEEYLSQYASFLQENHQGTQAQEMLSRLEQNPDNIFKRIVFALQDKNTEQATQLYQKLRSVEVSEDSENMKNYLAGEAAYWLELDDESIEYFKKVNGGERYMDARQMLSHLYYNQEKYDQAIEVLHQLQNAEQEYAVQAYRLEATIVGKQKNDKAAIRILTNSLKLIPNNSDLLYDRAMLYEADGKTKKAINDLEKIIEDNPEHEFALNALGYTMADHDIDLEKAHEYIQKAMEIKPDSAAIVDSLGWVQYKMGQYEEAEKNLQKAMELDDSDAEIYLHLYHALIKLDKKEEARELLRKAKDLFKDNKKVLDIND